MKSDLAKVLHKINGRPLVHYVIDLAVSLGSERTILIIGHQKELVMEECRNYPVEFAVQQQQLGTAHAVRMTEPLLADYDKDVLILSGDVPLLTEETLHDLITAHQESGAIATLLTSKLEDPTGYGRIIRDANGDVAKIVEHKDASEAERKIREINVGIYILKGRPLFEALGSVKNDNIQGEYYLPDVVKMFVDSGQKVIARITENFDETRGINTLEQLKEAETILDQRG
ncbi:MAG: UDP-N-acetylglucosamine pyrophosphorylase [Calditrichales bacterium]|nr:MAG: UDP-N-acetylglucosamine pyrophosphorylase [Calditrichales bacterium]